MDILRDFLASKPLVRSATVIGLLLGLTAATHYSSAEQASTSIRQSIASAIPDVPASVFEQRKLPMRFTWVACRADCRGWITADGIVTADTPHEFEAFAREHDVVGATVVLNSSGGSVNDTIALGRRWRDLAMRTTVGVSLEASGGQAYIAPQAYCESMCAFLLLAGKLRYVPDAAHVKLHQIWIGDRAHDAAAGSYSAQEITIIERDIGRLAKYTFDMGGDGELLSLSMSVPPWAELHEVSPAELRLTNLVTARSAAEVFTPKSGLSFLTGSKARSFGLPLAHVEGTFESPLPQTHAEGNRAAGASGAFETAAKH
jgi:hypothetical protein